MATYRNKQDDTIIRGSEFKLNISMDTIGGYNMGDEEIDKITVPDFGFFQLMGQALSGNGFGFPKSDAVYAFKEDVKAVE